MKNYSFILTIIVVCFKNSVGSYLSSCTDSKNFTTNRTEHFEIGPPLFYHDVESALKELEQPQYKQITEVQQLLEYYYKAKNKKAEFAASGGSKRHPLIVLEGLSGSGKTTIASTLITKLNGTKFHTPPRPLQALKIRRAFRDNLVLDTLYHFLSNYISALEVVQVLRDAPVVMDRYFHSTAAFCVSMAVNNFPEKYEFPLKDGKIYNWPDDLLKPDIVLFLDVTEDVRKQRIWGRRQILVDSNQNPSIQKTAPKQVFTRPDGLGNFMEKCPQFRENLIQAYKNVRSPSVVVINGDPPIQQVLEEIYSKIKPLFPNISFN